jgi:hypothetical protein
MMAKAYCTIDDVIAAMPDTQFSDEAKAGVAILLERASRYVDRLTGRADGAYLTDTESVRYYNGSGIETLWTDEMISTPSQVSYHDGLAWVDYAPADYYAIPPNGLPYHGLVLEATASPNVFPRGRRNIQVKALFGYSALPPLAIVQATLMIAVRWLKRGQQAYQDTGAVIDLGELRYTQAIDPEVWALLNESGLRRIAI